MYKVILKFNHLVDLTVT